MGEKYPIRGLGGEAVVVNTSTLDGDGRSYYFVSKFSDEVKKHPEKFGHVYLCKRVGLLVDEDRLRKLLGNLILETGLKTDGFWEVKGMCAANYASSELVTSVSHSIEYYTAQSVFFWSRQTLK